MAKGGLGIMVAKSVPAPDKLKDYKSKGSSGEPPESDEDDESGDEEAAGVSMMQEVFDAMGVKGDAAEACRTLDAYLEARGFVRR